MAPDLHGQWLYIAESCNATQGQRFPSVLQSEVPLVRCTFLLPSDASGPPKPRTPGMDASPSGSSFSLMDFPGAGEGSDGSEVVSDTLAWVGAC